MHNIDCYHKPTKTHLTVSPISILCLQPKLVQHCGQCRASGFTCIDCSRQFDRRTVQQHTQCVTEHEKYAQGATKPGGFASKGFFNDGQQQNTAAPVEGGAEGLEFLSTWAPWKCSVCNVTCTSQETLMGHAQGAKHKRRARAATAARNGGASNGNGAEANGAAAAAAAGTTTTPKEDEQVETKSDKEEKASNGDKKVSEKKVKWKKVAAAELKKAGKPMKTKKLIAALLANAGGEGVDGDAVLKKLQKSDAFEFEGKIVRLKA